MNDGGVCRTAPATPGLLTMMMNKTELGNKSNQNHAKCFSNLNSCFSYKCFAVNIKGRVNF